MKFHTGLVIGRFQPFHLGHEYLIQKALEHSEKIIIGIGSSNIKNKDNPYSVKTRKKFITDFIAQADIQDKVLKIVEIPDVPDDNEWYKIATQLAGPIDIVIGDNEWVNGIYETHRTPVLRVGYFKRDILKGTKIRQNIREEKPWKDRVPKYLISDIEKSKT